MHRLSSANGHLCVIKLSVSWIRILKASSITVKKIHNASLVMFQKERSRITCFKVIVRSVHARLVCSCLMQCNVTLCCVLNCLCSALFSIIVIALPTSYMSYLARCCLPPLSLLFHSPAPCFALSCSRNTHTVFYCCSNG